MLPGRQARAGHLDQPGRVIEQPDRLVVTLSPALISPCWLASRFMVTTGVVEVAVSTAPPAGEPSDPPTSLTRSAAGSNTACPNGRFPVTGSPR